MHGKAAANPRSGAMWASENAASVYLRGPRGNVEQRGAFRGVRTRGPGRRKETLDARHWMPLALTRRDRTLVALPCAIGESATRAYAHVILVLGAHARL
jgi:hypothetical protein